MSVIFVEIWTLKRGVIDPPEPVTPSVQVRMSRDYIEARFQRDPPLTEREWFQMERARGSYNRRGAA